jgi:hypothetical protein
MPTISELAEELNNRSEGRPIGQLQRVRRELHGRDHVPTHLLFDKRTIFGSYAFHVGGRRELQFNIGFELVEGQECLRHGVAFSLELNRNLPDIAPLLPKVARFNEFLRIYPDEFSDLRMWHFFGANRSTNYPAGAISPEIVKAGTFIFLGRLETSVQPDVAQILDDFDRLLPLYRFVEGDDAYPSISDVTGGFQFRPGCRVKPSATTGSVAARQLDIMLRHNQLQIALYNHLAGKHGKHSVATEQGTGSGTRMDVVVRFDDRYWFYEIKTAGSARACVREALAQLLEYSYWPGAQHAERLIIVGEPAQDAEVRAFLDRLREQFHLPIYYQQFMMEERKLADS